MVVLWTVAMPLQGDLQPRENIPNDVRTTDKNRAFELLEELREQDGLAGYSYNELADHAGYSRGHIQNVINDYYTKGERPDRVSVENLEIDVPANVDRRSYLKGYFDAYISGDRIDE